MASSRRLDSWKSGDIVFARISESVAPRLYPNYEVALDEVLYDDWIPDSIPGAEQSAKLRP